MVRQGDIVLVNFTPQSGHEQAGKRPAVVVSNDVFNEKTSMTIVCPVTNADNKFPLHVPLDGRTRTTGVILCEHVKALDIEAWGYKVVERALSDILARVCSLSAWKLKYCKRRAHVHGVGAERNGAGTWNCWAFCFCFSLKLGGGLKS